LLSTEGQTSAASSTCRHMNVDFVDEHLLRRQNADDAPARAVVLETDTAGNLRENRVVFTQPRVQARSEAPPALAHDDGAPADQVPVVRFHPQPLGIRVAAVSGAALTFLMSHKCPSRGFP